MLRVVNEKERMRRELKRIRDGLDPTLRQSIDERIACKVAALPSWRVASVVYSYFAFGAEVDTRSLIHRAWSEGKRVALPWCVPGTRSMRWFVVDDLGGLVRSPLGVEEPVPDPSRELDAAGTTDAIALVPGFSYDRSCFRLGYGGGYYDRFLVCFRGTSIGLCRDVQMSDEAMVREPHDLPVQIVVTESTVLAAGRSQQGRISVPGVTDAGKGVCA